MRVAGHSASSQFRSLQPTDRADSWRVILFTFQGTNDAVAFWIPFENADGVARIVLDTSGHSVFVLFGSLLSGLCSALFGAISVCHIDDDLNQFKICRLVCTDLHEDLFAEWNATVTFCLHRWQICSLS